ncbi:MAG: hypothetical protein ACRENU_12510 [Gemmatimonadaceae bacterium]
MKKQLRVAAWVGGSFVILFVLLLAVGMWSQRDYVFTNGRGLQDNVSGRWDWSTRKRPCSDSTHTIAFSDDGKVMTITMEFPVVDSTGKDDRVTTYDIVSTTTSRVRGAIRGETRLTADSTPVVWDLVVTGRDRYAWHRTDWEKWGLTPGNVRCPVPEMTDAHEEPKAEAPSPSANAGTTGITAAKDIADYYRGTIVNNQLPDARVPLELFIFHRSDSATSGWLRSGPPLETKGLTGVVVSGEDSLYLVTYAASGDTIVFGSETRTGDIGGEFWVSSGRHLGQGGSWRLVPAPRLSPATLGMMACLIAGGALLGLFALAGYGADRWWSWRNRQPLAVTDMQRAQMSSVGGWLVFIIVVQSIVAISLVVRYREVGEGLGDAWMLGAALGGFRPVLLIESATHVLQLLGLVGGIVLIVVKARITPVFWMAFLLTMLSYALFDITATGMMADRMVTLFGAESAAEFRSETEAAKRMNMRLIVGALVWSLYWARSRRVALVFAPKATGGASPPPSQPAGPSGVQSDFSLPAPSDNPQVRT